MTSANFRAMHPLNHHLSPTKLFGCILVANEAVCSALPLFSFPFILTCTVNALAMQLKKTSSIPSALSSKSTDCVKPLLATATMLKSDGGNRSIPTTVANVSGLITGNILRKSDVTYGRKTMR